MRVSSTNPLVEDERGCKGRTIVDASSGRHVASTSEEERPVKVT